MNKRPIFTVGNLSLELLLIGITLLILAIFGWMWTFSWQADAHSTPFAISERALEDQTPNAIQAPVKAVLGGLAKRPDFPPIGVALEKNVLQQIQTKQTGAACRRTVNWDAITNGVTTVSTYDNGICWNSDLDTYTRDDKTYVVLAGGWNMAWMHFDVTDPANPALLYRSEWDTRSYTPDIKTFHQGDSDYIAISMERLSGDGYCGVAIYDVTDPTAPVLQSHVDGDDWCDVHNLSVETDSQGDGIYLYLVADATADLRVLDISNKGEDDTVGHVTTPVEVGRYTAPEPGYFHDVMIMDHSPEQDGSQRRVYLSYWDLGLIILDAATVTPGINPTPLVGPGVIKPVDFSVHNVTASQDGDYAFIQDEFMDREGYEPVQMWNIQDLSNPTYIDGLELDQDVPANPAHNLELRSDIHPNRLYIGWYQMGLQAWDFTPSGFVRSNPSPRTAVLYHQPRSALQDDRWGGTWGVRLAEIDGNAYVFQSDRYHGLIINRVDVDPASTSVSTEQGGNQLLEFFFPLVNR